MEKALKRYLASIGKKGGQSRSSAKTRASKKNGRRGGRPKRYSEITAYEAMKEVAQGESWKISFMNFVDGFRRRPSHRLIQQDPKKLKSDPKMYALLQSICIELCYEQGMTSRGWLNRRAFLSEPWFVSGVKNLYAMALRDSPVAFRKNNIFVLDNFLSRI